MHIKLIATDLDGTLLRDDKSVSARTIAALAACRKMGIKTVYATARGHSAKMLLPPDLFDGFVRMGGAAAFAAEVELYSRRISTSALRQFMLAVDGAGIRMAAELDAWQYANFDTTQVWPWLTYSSIADFHTLDIQVEKLYALPMTQTEIDLLERLLPQGLRMVVDREMFTSISHIEATKARALAALAAYWGIGRSDIVAFGDDLNDMDMLAYAGVGIAMGNAVADVKATADIVCASNEDDGVAKWLEQNVLAQTAPKESGL